MSGIKAEMSEEKNKVAEVNDDDSFVWQQMRRSRRSNHIRRAQHACGGEKHCADLTSQTEVESASGVKEKHSEVNLGEEIHLATKPFEPFAITSNFRYMPAQIIIFMK